jgi:SagB-type dehydrogenase family enzyme
VTLPQVPAVGEFANVLLGRRTWRGFGKAPATLEALAQLLDLTWGVRFWGDAASGDPVAFKTSPSAGARHPIEAYLLALRVKGLARGLYHYVPDTKELEQLRPGATPLQLEGYLAGQWPYRSAAFVVFMTGVVARELWRYDHPRSFRTMLLDAGHLCQTFCLVATWLGLAPFCTAALADSRIERDLGLDGVSEILLYAAGAGTRPADGRWVQWPEHRPRHPYLPPSPSRRSARSRKRRPAGPPR